MGGDSAEQRETAAGELPLALLRRYAAYCRARCGPRLSANASERLRARYVLMRTGASQHERQADKRLSIPITVRYVPYAGTRRCLLPNTITRVPLRTPTQPPTIVPFHVACSAKRVYMNGLIRDHTL